MTKVMTPMVRPTSSLRHALSSVLQPLLTRFQAWLSGLVMVLLPGKGPTPGVVPRDPMYSHSPAQISWMLCGTGGRVQYKQAWRMDVVRGVAVVLVVELR